MRGQLYAIAVKDLKIFFGDPGAVVLIFLMPLMFIVLMSYALAGAFSTVRDQAIPLPVVVEDDGPAAGQLLDALDAERAFTVERRFGGAPLDRQTLERLIAEGERSFGLIIPAGFSAALTDRSAATPAPVELMADPSATLQVIEPVRGALAGLLQVILVRSVVPAEVDRLVDDLGPSSLLVDRGAIKERVNRMIAGLLEPGQGQTQGVRRSAPAGMRTEQAPDPFQQNVPGYTLFGIFWIVVLLAESVLLERKDGTFRRLLVAPMSRATLLLGKLLPYFLINLMQVAAMLLVARLLFGMDLGASPAGLMLVSLAASAAATGLGVMVSALARTEAQTRGLTILVLLALAALGGCFVPRFIMPAALQTAGLVTPHAWALDAYQDLLVRGLGLVDVLPEVGALLAFAALFFTVGVWRFRFE